ncbi:hypothetical protein CIHG_08191 [Coccidioides immitis H538.4]|uniref:Hydrophobin n=3 Tax=Coccidioides immitis TaxID=5501 RepID=A0A0J8R2N6_COCIT|nr:hypothetical protein CIRG_04262 [Coccidioides immitis RMSCC 2394]KMU79424.1 hypothetical protein CISG_07855 [Coccidioides immitis RMSCC 3703]KMU90381.1 hypothetical protein CIHG_08191 [Coccidioides immitis H538.4]
MAVWCTLLPMILGCQCQYEPRSIKSDTCAKGSIGNILGIFVTDNTSELMDLEINRVKRLLTPDTRRRIGDQTVVQATRECPPTEDCSPISVGCSVDDRKLPGSGIKIDGLFQKAKSYKGRTRNEIKSQSR